MADPANNDKNDRITPNASGVPIRRKKKNIGKKFMPTIIKIKVKPGTAYLNEKYSLADIIDSCTHLYIYVICGLVPAVDPCMV